MAMRYAKPEDVYTLLRVVTNPVDPNYDAEVIARLDRIENGLALNFDEKCNTSFGVAPVAETRSVWWNGSYAPGTGMFYPITEFYTDYVYGLRANADSYDMILNSRLRSLTSIRTNGDWNGTAWVDDDLVPVANYYLIHQDGPGYWGIRSTYGSWSGIYRVTGIWSDQAEAATVPDDVREAVTFLVCDQYRMLNSSPEGTLGPQGQMIRTRNPWSYVSVSEAINRHTVLELIV